MFSSFRQEFDPLDREILERAFDVAWATVKETGGLDTESDSDEKLTATLRSNLIEITIGTQCLAPDKAHAVARVETNDLCELRACAHRCDRVRRSPYNDSIEHTRNEEIPFGILVSTPPVHDRKMAGDGMSRRSGRGEKRYETARQNRAGRKL